MNFQDYFRKVFELLESRKIQYALAGGMVSSLYRKHARATQDLDFVVFSKDSTEQTCKDILQTLGLEIILLRKAQLEGGPMFAIKNNSTPIWMICGRKKQAIGVDFLLPGIPWTEEAIQRAQHHKINFGFGSVPCITPEDLILSKLLSFYNQKTRFMDLDDLQSIFQKKNELDLVYLIRRLDELSLNIPLQIKESCPKELSKWLK